MILPGDDLELALVFGPGSDIIMGLRAVLVRDVQIIEIDKLVLGFLCDLIDGYHAFSLLYDGRHFAESLRYMQAVRRALFRFLLEQACQISFCQYAQSPDRP